MTRVRIVTANVYTANKREDAAEEALERRAADVILSQEGHWLARLSGYRLHRAERAGGDKHSTQNAVHVLARHTYEGHGAYRVTEEIEGDKFAPDRWITWARFLVDGMHPVAAISTHVNAVLQTSSGAMRTGPRIDQARRHMVALGREIKRQQADGFDVVVGLDANYRRVPGVPLWRHSPHTVFKREGLTYVPRRIDGIAVPRRARVLDAGSFVIPGGDHHGFEVTAEIPRGR